jgi:hypothetical protein
LFCAVVAEVVVPVGSLQIENGVNFSRSDVGRTFDGTNTRLRLGIAPCLELLLDVPSYVTALGSRRPSGFTNVAPGVKSQISPIAGKFDLSATIGAGLPTGAPAIAGDGLQPYLQFPWSVELGGSWAITGMVTNFFTPADTVNKYANQSTLVLEKRLSEQAFVFAEYVGEFKLVGGTSNLLNFGGGYRITDTQQVDFHFSLGLNRNAPTYMFGLGYSARIDGLL